MKNLTNTILYIIFSIFLLSSCEDVIEIKLDSIEPKLVVEGAVNDVDSILKIKLSKTGDYFHPSEYPKVSGAKITLAENNKNYKSLEETEPGVYSIDIDCKQNMLYTLNIESDDKTYEAEATIPAKISIDSLTAMYSPPTPHRKEGFVVNCHFTDNPEVTNYFRLRVRKADTVNNEKRFFIFDDKFIEGNSATMPWQYDIFQITDTVVVELLSLDKSTYFFYKTLSDIAGSGMPGGGSTPANPETNLTNDALGYFGAYAISRDTIIVMPF